MYMGKQLKAQADRIHKNLGVSHLHQHARTKDCNWSIHIRHTLRCINWQQTHLNPDGGSYCHHLERGAVVINSVEMRLSTDLLSFPNNYSWVILKIFRISGIQFHLFKVRERSSTKGKISILYLSIHITTISSHCKFAQNNGYFQILL